MPQLSRSLNNRKEMSLRKYEAGRYVLGKGGSWSKTLIENKTDRPNKPMKFPVSRPYRTRERWVVIDEEEVGRGWIVFSL